MTGWTFGSSFFADDLHSVRGYLSGTSLVYSDVFYGRCCEDGELYEGKNK